MPQSSRKEDVYSYILLVVAVACLIATAIQYPLSTTFPIGGDAAAIISRVQHILTSPLSTLYTVLHTWYPVSYILFSLNALNPFVYWPTAFSWWMALGQIATGLSLGLFAYRLWNLRAAAIAMALWAITPITLTSFFEDGTMAQLWSLPWVLLFLERLYMKSPWGMSITLALLLLSHPVTAFFCMAVALMTLPHLLFQSDIHPITRKKMVWRSLTLGALLLFSVLFFVITQNRLLAMKFHFESSKYSYDIFHGFFLPWLFAAIVGSIRIGEKYRKKKVLPITLASFLCLSLFFAVNDQLGIGFWTNRLNVYLILSLCIAGAIGFTSMFEKLRYPVLATLLTGFLLSGVTISTFQDNRNIYGRYESPSTYSRLHPGELAAISWMKEHVEKGGTIVSSGATRNYEWIPVLSKLIWAPTPERDMMYVRRYKTIEHPYLVFFTKKEKAPEWVTGHPEIYHEEFQNDAAVIYSISL